MSSPTSSSTSSSPHSSGLRWHPARLLYLFVFSLLIGILFSEVQALLTNPASALDPTQARQTFFWNLAFTYPLYTSVAAALAVGAALVGWRLDQRYSMAQEALRLPAPAWLLS